MIQYSGINGRFQVTNAPLPLQNLLSGDPEMFYVKVSDGISSIKLLAKGEPDKQAIKDLTWAAGTVYKLSGIQCTSIQQIIPQNALENILNCIRTNLLNIFIKLEKEYGNIDDLDIYFVENLPQNNIANKSNSIVSKNDIDDLDISQKENRIKKSIHIGNHNKIINSNIGENNKLNLASEKAKEKWYEKYYGI